MPGVESSGYWGPPPPGLDLTESSEDEILRSVVAFMVLGVVAVILRIVARLKSRAKLAIDDYLCLIALVFGIGTAVLCIISLPPGGGRHLWVLTFDDFETLWKMTYAFVLIYATTITLTKMSILFFYRRIFGVNWAHHVCMALAMGYWVAIVIAWVTGCRPASFFWKQFTDPTAKGTCINTSLFYFVNGICAMLIDVAILCTPIPTIWKLQMASGQKIAVVGILLLGAFVCVASIIRIYYMDKLVKAQDFTWAMAQVFIWSCCEPFVGIICACLPTYGPLLIRWWKTAVGSEQYKSGGGSFNPVNTKVERNKARQEWKQLHGGDDVKYRQDDEMELTNDISGGPQGSLRTKTSDEEVGQPGRAGGNIRVQNEFSFVHGPRNS